MKFRIALVQFKFKLSDPATNLSRAEQFIRRAVRARADLVVFPENIVTGSGPAARELADRDGSFRRSAQALARKYRIDLVPGTMTERRRGRLYNTTYYVDRSGRVLGRYRKIHLWLSEKTWVTPGRAPTVCRTRFGNVGLAICWDLAFPELFRSMFRRRAVLALCMACWSRQDAGTGVRHNPRAEEVFVDSCCTAHAFANEMAVGFCNVAGSWSRPHMRFQSMGHTQVALPFVGPAAILRHNREAMLLCDVDTAILGEAEVSYEIKKDLLENKTKS